MTQLNLRSLPRLLPHGMALGFLLVLGALIVPNPSGRAETVLDPATNLPMATPRVIPIEEDPRDPKASRAERIRRQQVRFQKQLQEAKDRAAAVKEGKATPTPAPAGGGAATTETTPPAPDPNAPNQNQVNAGVAQPAPTPLQPPGVQTVPGPGPGQGGTEQSGLGISSAARKPFTSFVLDPASAVLKVGEHFATTARLANPDHLPIDRIHIMLDYPERSLKPIAIHTDRLLTIQKDEPVIALEPEIGVLACSAEFAQAINLLEIELITIEWEAIAPTDRATIEPFLNGDYSGAFFGEQRQTESVLGESEAVSGASVRINPADVEIPLGMKMVDYSLDQMQTTLGNMKDQSHLTPPTLWIDEQSSGTLDTGDWLIVDFGLNNPSKMIFDEVRLACRFDPTAIEIVDADRDNLMLKGVNLLDGLFHEAWRWDTAITNNVNNKAGVIYYRSTTQDRREMPSGIIARAVCRVLKPVEGPVFTWLWNAEASVEEPQTGVYLAGRNVYLRKKDEPGRGEAGAEGAIPVDKDSYVWNGIEKANPSVYKF